LLGLKERLVGAQDAENQAIRRRRRKWFDASAGEPPNRTDRGGNWKKVQASGK